jgi:hypothetical protein
VCTVEDTARSFINDKFSFPSLWLYSHLDLRHFFSFLIYIESVGLPWMGYQPFTRSLPTHKTIQTQNKRNIYPCFGWDSNARSQCSKRRRRFIHRTAEPPWSALMITVITKCPFCTKISLMKGSGLRYFGRDSL